MKQKAFIWVFAIFVVLLILGSFSYWYVVSGSVLAHCLKSVRFCEESAISLNDKPNQLKPLSPEIPLQEKNENKNQKQREYQIVGHNNHIYVSNIILELGYCELKLLCGNLQCLRNFKYQYTVNKLRFEFESQEIQIVLLFIDYSNDENVMLQKPESSYSNSFMWYLAMKFKNYLKENSYSHFKRELDEYLSRVDKHLNGTQILDKANKNDFTAMLRNVYEITTRRIRKRDCMKNQHDSVEIDCIKKYYDPVKKNNFVSIDRNKLNWKNKSNEDLVISVIRRFSHCPVTPLHNNLETVSNIGVIPIV
ncbi:hypothetical protein EDEG_03289 [Edhazardia aedis USNM 41457]|uniref:Plasmodium RESA N-terminal domain-containing protein n=1 Tax=Edhazardia aedis (strain USNM 41457) TaxID=1003232 RepID=J9DI14_EDHAE|nr:hypothetical protein EDEG_03289 [Edhazardia aedis USNM 41457]|eukprot:EJW02265.1 hypothetical protein EDEG_03289 [Edhazardia aedis USNM 41457]